MENNEVPYRYYNNSASAGSSYLAHVINTTQAAAALSEDRSTNFLRVDVTFISGTGATGKTLSATLHICISSFNPGSTYFWFYPVGITTDYEFPIGTSPNHNEKYSDLKYPDEASYYNYFKIYFSVESGSNSNIGVNVTTPNVNGKLLVETTQIYFRV